MTEQKRLWLASIAAVAITLVTIGAALMLRGAP
jgi:hypothetical protein